MDWQGFIDWLTGVTNNPVFISLMSIGATLGSVLVVISKTSFGRKAIKQLTLLGETTRNEVTSIRNEIKKAKDELIKQKDEIIKEKDEFLAKVDVKFKEFYNQFEFYEASMINILSLIPNKEVQKAVETMKAEWAVKKEEIKEFVGISYTEAENKINELTEKVNKLLEEKENVRDNSTTEE